MANLSKQTKKVTYIISLKYHNPMETYELMTSLGKYFDRCCDFYAYILHDQDTDDNGKLKTEHIHCVCMYDSSYSKTRLSTHLNNLCADEQSGGLDLWVKCVTVNYAKDFIGNVQYLIHKNDPQKFQYSPTLIHTNNVDLLNDYLNSDSDMLTADRLVSICKECNFNKVKIMYKLTPSVYAHYRPTICDIIDDFIRNK